MVKLLAPVGNENMKGVGIVWVGIRDVYASDFGDE